MDSRTTTGSVSGQVSTAREGRWRWLAGDPASRGTSMTTRPIQIIGQLGRRHPTQAEMARRVPFVLTERDVRVLTAIFTHGFLTVELIERAYFPPRDRARRARSSLAYDRLRLYWLWGFVDRVVRPSPPGVGARHPDLLTLGARAIPVVARRLDLDPATVRRRRLDRINPFGIEHELTVARLWAYLRAALARRPGAALRWTSERVLRARHDQVDDPALRRALPFLPDAYVELDLPPGATRCFLVEVDRGSLTWERFARKVRAFELFLAEGAFARSYGRPSFEVLILGESEERLDNLARVARVIVPDERHPAYHFARADSLDATPLAAPTWRTLEGERVAFLPPSLACTSPKEDAARTSSPGARRARPPAPPEDGAEGDADVSP